MESFNREQKKREIVHTKKGEQIVTDEFTEYTTSDPFYKSSTNLFFPEYEKIDLILDFLDQSLNPIVNFSRSSTATYWNDSGVLVEAQEDQPRFDYNPNNGNLLGLLIENQQTNNVLDSTDPTTANWSTSSSEISLSGSQNTVIQNYNGVLVSDSGNGGTTENYQQTIGNFTGNDETTSLIFEKSSGEISITIFDNNQSSNEIHADINIDTESINVVSGSGSVLLEKISDDGVNNGKVFKAILTTSGTSGNSKIVRIHPSVYNTAEASDMYHYHLQDEESTYSTSPILTSGSTATRQGDLAYIDNLTFINRDEGTFIFNSYYRSNSGVSPISTLSDNTIDNKIGVSFNDDSAEFTFTQDGQSLIASNDLEDTKEFKKLSFTYNINDEYSGTTEQSQLVDSPVDNIDWASRFYIGANYDGSQKMDSHLRKIYYYGESLSSGEIENYTK